MNYISMPSNLDTKPTNKTRTILSTEAIENIKKGEELSHFASLLFEQAAGEWHWGVGLEMLTGLFMVLMVEVGLSHELKLLCAFFGFISFTIAYSLRFKAEDTFDLAQTMHRQSVLSESLGWPVNHLQFSEWIRRAGTAALKQFKATTRPPDYYATKAAPGPRKLLEVTLESGFLTRRVYFKLRKLMWFFFAGMIVFTIVIIGFSMLRVVSQTEQLQLVSVVFLALPAVMLFDVLEWILKLNRLTDGIREVEIDLERLAELPEVTESQVMRLISEYNCVVVDGFPIHPKLYKRWREEIRELWESRNI